MPVRYRDQVIGTFNVESPNREAFGEADLQLAEIFCRDIAEALHTLDLLSAEKSGATTESIEAVSRAVAHEPTPSLSVTTSLSRMRRTLRR